MARLSELMYQSAAQNISKSVPDIVGALKNGAELALQEAKLQQNQQQLANTEQQLRNKAIGSTLQIIESSQKFKSEADRRRFLKGALPGAVEAYGTADVFTPEMQDMLINSGDAQRAMTMIIGKVRSNQMTQDEAIQFMNMAGLADAIEHNRMDEAEKFRLSELGKTERAKMIAGATAARQERSLEAQAVQSDKDFARTGAKKLAEETSKAYSVFKNAGGAASMDAAIKGYEEAIAALENNEVQFGTLAKNIPYASTEDVLARTDPKAKALIDQIRNNINIRAKTGDPNPTEKQINLILARSVDPRLDNKANIKKLRDEVERMRAEKKDKLELFRKAGLEVAPAPKQAGIDTRSDIVFGGGVPGASKLTKDAWLSLPPATKQMLMQKLGLTEAQINMGLGIK